VPLNHPLLFLSQAPSPTWPHSTLRASSAIPLPRQGILVRPFISSAFRDTANSTPRSKLPLARPTPVPWFHSSCHHRTSVWIAKPPSLLLRPKSLLSTCTGHTHHHPAVEQAHVQPTKRAQRTLCR